MVRTVDKKPTAESLAFAQKPEFKEAVKTVKRLVEFDDDLNQYRLKDKSRHKTLDKLQTLYNDIRNKENVEQNTDAFARLIRGSEGRNLRNALEKLDKALETIKTMRTKAGFTRSLPVGAVAPDDGDVLNGAWDQVWEGARKMGIIEENYLSGLPMSAMDAHNFPPLPPGRRRINAVERDPRGR